MEMKMKELNLRKIFNFTIMLNFLLMFSIVLAQEIEKKEFSLKEAGKVSIYLFDLNGRVVEKYDAELNAGVNDVGIQTLNMKNQGIYFYRVIAPEFSREGKVIFNR